MGELFHPLGYSQGVVKKRPRFFRLLETSRLSVLIKKTFPKLRRPHSFYSDKRSLGTPSFFVDLSNRAGFDSNASPRVDEGTGPGRRKMAEDQLEWSLTPSVDVEETSLVPKSRSRMTVNPDMFKRN